MSGPKILAINGSPSGKHGATALILNPFVEGAKQAGADVDLVELVSRKIKPCLGELACWGPSPGKCIQKDDMAELLLKIDQADILVYACPVYIDTVAGLMKNFLDRHVPLMEPQVVLQNGHCRHPRRVKKKQKMVAISVCGFYEMDNFDLLIQTIKAMTENFDVEFAGAILRPYGTFLKSGKVPEEVKNSILDAARRAGNEIVKEGAFRKETINEVAKPFLPLEAYVQAINKYWSNVKAS